MRVAVWDEMAAKGVNPVARRSHETGVFFTLIVTGDGMGVRSNVRRLEGGIVVEDRRVKSAVIIGIGLDEKTVRENLAAVAEQQAEKIIRLSAIVFERLKLRLQMSG